MTKTEMLTDDILARQAIRDLIVRYSWAIKRADAELMRSLYWPDAEEDHGDYVGPIEGFIDWLMPRLHSRAETTIALSNTEIALSGSTAHAESLGHIHIRKPDGKGGQHDLIGGSRYVDELECRGGEWRIRRRRAVLEWLRDLGSIPS